MIDIVVVGMMIFGALPPPIGMDVGGFKCVRIVRVVRPLQKQNQDVKTLLAALMTSFTSIMHVINLLMLLIFIFGLMGVNLFRGRFHFCNDESMLQGYEHCVGTNFGGRPDIPCVVSAPPSRPPSDLGDMSAVNCTGGIGFNTTSNSTFDCINTTMTKDPGYSTWAPDMCEQDIGKFLGQEILVPRVWRVKRENFDNLYNALLLLLRLSSQDNFRPIFHSVMDIPKTNEYLCPGSNDDATNGCPNAKTPFNKARQPVVNAVPENILFPITYIFLANVFVSQLVIGVLIDNIRRQAGTALYTEEQRIWNATRQTIERLSMKIKPPNLAGSQKILYDFLNSDNYEIFITTIIIVNTLWMATEHEPHVQLYLDIALIVGWFFIIIYVSETFAKLYVFQPLSITFIEEKEWNDDDKAEMKEKGGMFTAYRLKWRYTRIRSPYFSDAWNTFDFVVVFFSVLDQLKLINFPVLKLLRVLRVLRLVRRVKTLQMMLVTLIKAIPSILAALLFLGIFIFIWAAVGSDVSFFLQLKQGSVIDRTWNFRYLELEVHLYALHRNVVTCRRLRHSCMGMHVRITRQNPRVNLTSGLAGRRHTKTSGSGHPKTSSLPHNANSSCSIVCALSAHSTCMRTQRRNEGTDAQSPATLHTHQHSSLMNAMLLLFRTATGDGWFDLIYDASIAPPFCTSTVPAGATMADGLFLLHDHKGDCG